MLIEITSYQHAGRQFHEMRESALRTAHDWLVTYGGEGAQCRYLAKIASTSTLYAQRSNADALRRKLVSEFNPSAMTARQAASTICAASMLTSLIDAHETCRERDPRDSRFEVPCEIEMSLLALAEGKHHEDQPLRPLADHAIARLVSGPDDDTVRSECQIGNVGCMALAWARSHDSASLACSETVLDQTT